MTPDTLINTALLGMEQVQRSVFRRMFDDLNDAIETVNDYMLTSDQAIWVQTGNDIDDFEATDLEVIPATNFYEGHIPSLIDAPIDKYPNCSVVSARSTASAGHDQLDHSSAHEDTILIDVMVKSITTEEEVNRRAHRTVEAVNICVMEDDTFGGVINGVRTAPNVFMGDVFTRKERSSYGPHWFWQGARLEYAVRKEAVTPDSTGSVFRTVGIDQA